jgi:hypothetical protein
VFVIQLRKYFQPNLVVAAGATLGGEHFERMVSELPPLNAPSEVPVAIDFEGIEDATSSYLKATLLALHQSGRLHAKALPAHELQEQSTQLQPLNITVVVLNATAAVSDCIHEVFARRGLAVLSGTRLNGERLEDAVLLGELEPAAMEALTLSCQFPEFQAADLHGVQSTKPITVTGWNNRMAEVHGQRLVRRRTEGRTHRFIPLANKVHAHGEVLSRK